MHYKSLQMPWGLPDWASNIAIIVIDFMDPPLVTVKEEYLVYDGVALISSVGGLLGICVGVSFHGFSSGVLYYVGQMLRRGKNNFKSGSAGHRFTTTFVQEKEPSQCMTEIIKMKTALEEIRKQIRGVVE